jgi:hypothetical protein
MTERRPRRRSLWTQPWPQLGVLIVVGDVLLLALAHPALRSAASFVGAALLGGIVFQLGAASVRFAGRISPTVAMAVALGNYGLTVALLAVVFALSSPRVVVPAAVAAGFVCAVLVWVGSSVRSLAADVNAH